MIKKHGKIIEATIRELFKYWLDDDICEIMSFDRWVKEIKDRWGTKIIKSDEEE